jgi:hypothetical protein
MLPGRVVEQQDVRVCADLQQDVRGRRGEGEVLKPASIQLGAATQVRVYNCIHEGKFGCDTVVTEIEQVAVGCGETVLCADGGHVGVIYAAVQVRQKGCTTHRAGHSATVIGCVIGD